MNDHEYLTLCEVIDNGDLVSGKVLKLGGKWYVKGRRGVPRPRIGAASRLGMWTEGTKRGVVIEQRGNNERHS